MRRVQEIRWAERDFGQKLSIVMFGVCIAVVTGLMVFAGWRAAANGDWGAMIAPGGFILLLVSLWMNSARSRDAR